WIFRVLVFAGPIIAFIVTKRICIGLQRADAHLLHEGVETGVIKRLPAGGYEEVTRELSEDVKATIEATQPEQPEPLPAGTDDRGVEAKFRLVGRLRVSAQRWYTRDNVVRDGHADGHGNGHVEHEAVEAGEDKPKQLSGRPE